MTEVFLKPEFVAAIRAEAVKKDQNLHHTNFFDLLQTTVGLGVLQAWFSSQAGTEIEEYNFKKVLSSMCLRVTDVESWEIFDSFTLESVITFREFCFLVFLYAAAETQQTKTLLYLHGATFYSLLAGKETNEITSERMLRLGRFLKQEDRFLISKLKELNLTMKSKVNFDLFQLYYFDLFSDWDYKEESQYEEEVKSQEPVLVVGNLVPPVVGPPPVQKKKKSTGCRSKLCVLL